ncbi:hypothetical protein C9374_005936 [Naegleria lovaniensis]|uniref:Uncharacterized protein n=1 Tax=Naegleria lovaniensis TaxID=51637 RepID=A0AA88GNG5_NAELO|nr:uncharacterized protein C9374_005936 [Naegleria lovaniensis]KAG2381552.1 hypothetical protein C9374_005936 [Naegleria lovaniensis]
MEETIAHLVQASNPTASLRRTDEEDQSQAMHWDFRQWEDMRQQAIEKDKNDDQEQLQQFSKMHKRDLIELFFEEKLKHRTPVQLHMISSLKQRAPYKSQKKREKFQKTIFGYCRECHEKVNGGLQAMKEHILTCEKLNDFKEGDVCEDAVLRFKIYPRYGDTWNKYWLFVEVPFTNYLKALDGILRDYWVECCEHSSSFEIDNYTYYSWDENEGFFRLQNILEFDQKTMSLPMYRVFKPSDVGKLFCYTYDRGSPTELEIELISIVKCHDERIAARVLARNNPPTFKCRRCNKDAEYVDGEEMNFYCDKHAKEEDKDLEWLLPVVNSPRMGVCGYCGDGDNYAPPSSTEKKKKKHKKN